MVTEADADEGTLYRLWDPQNTQAGSAYVHEGHSRFNAIELTEGTWTVKREAALIASFRVVTWNGTIHVDPSQVIVFPDGDEFLPALSSYYGIPPVGPANVGWIDFDGNILGLISVGAQHDDDQDVSAIDVATVYVDGQNRNMTGGCGLPGGTLPPSWSLRVAWAAPTAGLAVAPVGATLRLASCQDGPGPFEEPLEIVIAAAEGVRYGTWFFAEGWSNGQHGFRVGTLGSWDAV